MGNENILYECTKCHTFFNNTEVKRINREGRIELVSPCCEREFKVYFDFDTELFVQNLIKEL